MITYNMVLVTEQNKSLFRRFFYTHFKQRAYYMDLNISKNQYKYMVVAYDDLELVGLLPITFKKNKHGLDYMIVHSDYRNLGIGPKIIREAVERLILKGHNIICRMYEKSKFFESLDFQLITDSFEGKPEHYRWFYEYKLGD